MTQKDFQYALRFQYVSARVAEYFLFIAHSELVRFISRCYSLQEKVLISLPLLLLPIRARRGNEKRKSRETNMKKQIKFISLHYSYRYCPLEAPCGPLPFLASVAWPRHLAATPFFSNKWLLKQEEAARLPPAVRSLDGCEEESNLSKLLSVIFNKNTLLHL